MCFRSLGNFRSLEWSGACGLTARVGGRWGRGKAVRPKSEVKRWLWKLPRERSVGGRESDRVSRRRLEGELKAWQSRTTGNKTSESRGFSKPAEHRTVEAIQLTPSVQ